jgi:hypothetical protein
MLRRLRLRSRFGLVARSAIPVAALAALLAVDSLGCDAEHMRPVSADTAVPVDARSATVVFVRPKVAPAAVNFTWVDVASDGTRFLGESPPTSHFAVPLPPGEHTFVAWGGDHEDSVRATLAPGRVYVVALLSELFHPLELRAVRRDDEDAARWIEDTTALAPDREDGQRDLVKDPRKLDEHLEDARAAWRGLDHDEIAERTLGPDDTQ